MIWVSARSCPARRIGLIVAGWCSADWRAEVEERSWLYMAADDEAGVGFEFLVVVRFGGARCCSPAVAQIGTRFDPKQTVLALNKNVAGAILHLLAGIV